MPLKTPKSAYLVVLYVWVPIYLVYALAVFFEAKHKIPNADFPESSLIAVSGQYLWVAPQRRGINWLVTGQDRYPFFCRLETSVGCVPVEYRGHQLKVWYSPISPAFALKVVDIETGAILVSTARQREEIRSHIWWLQLKMQACICIGVVLLGFVLVRKIFTAERTA
jgi:hypothetical protein